MAGRLIGLRRGASQLRSHATQLGLKRWASAEAYMGKLWRFRRQNRNVVKKMAENEMDEGKKDV